MRKSFIAIVLTLMTCSVIAQQSVPQWVLDIQNLNKDLVDSIVPYAPNKTAPEYSSYLIYYHQPLSHANPQGAQTPMRALLTVDNRQKPTEAVNHVYFSGYNIMTDYLAAPDSLLKASDEDDATEILFRYRANWIQPEHRYFAFSAPEKCWTNLDYCTAAEATEDFHALIEGLKKVFKGKWVISGVSKGGITTAIQHAYHPEDADIFLPYAAPFFDTDRDTLMQKYWYNNGWDQKLLDMYMGIRRTVLQNKSTVYPIFEKMNAGNNSSPAHLDSVYGSYLLSTLDFGFREHTSSDTAKIRRQIYKNDSILRVMNMSYGDTVYTYMISSGSLVLDKFKTWLDTLRKYPDPIRGPQRVVHRQGRTPFGITEKEWFGNDEIPSTAYHYQAKCELGYYDYRFDDILGKEKAADLNTYWKEHFTCAQCFYNPFFASCNFSRNLYDFVTNATRNATKPVVFIYGKDDAWTGAAIRDEFINGSNVRKFILPNQNHEVYFMSNTDPAQCAEIKRILDGVLGEPKDIEQVGMKQNNIGVRKIFQNGQIIIIRNNEKYDITGKKM